MPNWTETAPTTEVACPLGCTEGERRRVVDTVWEAPEAAVYQCTNCEVVFIDPIMSEDEEREFYEAEIMRGAWGVRQLDEFRNLQKQLPPLGSPLAVPTPLAGKLRELTPSELDTFQLVLDHGQLQRWTGCAEQTQERAQRLTGGGVLAAVGAAEQHLGRVRRQQDLRQQADAVRSYL